MSANLETIEPGTCPCGKHIVSVTLCVRLPFEYIPVCSRECAARLIAFADIETKVKQ